MKKILFFCICLVSFSCEEKIEPIRKMELSDLKEMGIGTGDESFKKLKQFAATYSPDEVGAAKNVGITRAHLQELDNSLNDFPIKDLIIYENNFPERRLDFPGILTLEKLQVINESITDIMFKSKMPKLKTLILRDNRNLAMFPNLDNLPAIEELDMRDGTHKQYLIPQIPPGPVIPSLKRLRFGGTLSSLANIERFPNLTWLVIEKSQLKDLSGIEKLSKLTYLNVSDSQLRDFSALKGRAGILQLTFDRNGLTEIPDFSDMPNLKSLSLRGNKITSMASLKKMVNLQDFSLGENQIQKIEGLEVFGKDYRNNSDIFGGNPLKEITRASWEKFQKAGETYEFVVEGGVREGRIKIVDN